MFLSKNDLEPIERELKHLRERLEKNEEANSREIHHVDKKLDSLILALNTHLEDKNGRNKEIGELLGHEVEKVAIYADGLRKRIEGLRMVEDRLEKSLLDDASAEIRQQIQSMFHVTREYEKLQADMIEVSKTIKTIKVEMDKFVQISSNIKQSDFILAEYAKKVTAIDHEKLSLMRENEMLKGIISKQRRNQPQQR